MSRKRLFLFISLVFFLGTGTYLFVKKPWQTISGDVGANRDSPVLIDYEDKKFGFKLKYPEGFVVGKISEEQQKQDPLMLKLVRENPPELVLFWRGGLGVVAAFTKEPLFEYLRGNVDRRFEAEYNDFKKESIEDTALGGLEAFTVWFTYQNTEKAYREKIKLTVTVKDKAGFYLQCMAPESMWQFAEPSCDIIKDSFEFFEVEVE